MPGLGPGIHAFAGASRVLARATDAPRRGLPAQRASAAQVVDGRPKAGHDA